MSLCNGWTGLFPISRGHSCSLQSGNDRDPYGDALNLTAVGTLARGKLPLRGDRSTTQIAIRS
jgi:hypothetical protein